MRSGCSAGGAAPPHNPAMITTPQNPSPELEFPLLWDGRIIAAAAVPGVEKDIRRVLQGFGMTALPRAGRRSRAGTYITYQVSVTLADKATMIRVMEALSDIDGVRTVL